MVTRFGVHLSCFSWIAVWTGLVQPCIGPLGAVCGVFCLAQVWGCWRFSALAGCCRLLCPCVLPCVGCAGVPVLAGHCLMFVGVPGGGLFCWCFSALAGCCLLEGCGAWLLSAGMHWGQLMYPSRCRAIQKTKKKERRGFAEEHAF